MIEEVYLVYNIEPRVLRVCSTLKRAKQYAEEECVLVGYVYGWDDGAFGTHILRSARSDNEAMLITAYVQKMEVD